MINFDYDSFKRYTEASPSELGLRVANFLHKWLGGFHRIEPDLRGKVDWASEYYIVIPLPQHFQLSTWDFNRLTSLVVLSHDALLRVEVNPRHYRWLELVFHSREREGRIMERLPTIEEHIKLIRGEK